MLKRSLERDSRFALAAALLGDIEFQQGHLREGYEAYGKALQIGSEERLSLRERARIKGIIADDMGDFEAAEAAYREYTLYYPNDALAWFRRGRPLLMLGRPQESIVVLTQAHKRDPGRAGTVVQIVRANLVTRDFQEVQRLLEELRGKAPRTMYLYSLGPAQFVQGDYEGARRTFDELSRSEDGGFSLSGVQMLAELKTERGEYRGASALLKERLRLTPEAHALRFDAAHIACRMGLYEECASDIKWVLAKENSPSQLIVASQILGRELAFAPRTKTSVLRDLLRSLQLSDRGFEPGLIFEIAKARLQGEQLLASGDAKGAIADLRRASAMDAPFSSREYLARALTVMAGGLRDQAKASAMLREAMGYYAQAAQTAGMVWQYPPDYPPGFYADQIEAWLGLAARVPVPGEEREQMLRALASLRPGAAESLRSRQGGEPHEMGPLHSTAP